MTFTGKSLTDLTVQEKEDLNAFKDGLSKFDHEWTAMQGSMRNVHNIEPMIVPCQLDVEETFSFVVKKIEGMKIFRCMKKEARLSCSVSHGAILFYFVGILFY